MGTQENCSATWLAVFGFMVIGLVSGLSLANHSESFLVVSSLVQPKWMPERILGGGQTCGVSFWPFPNSSSWWRLISSMFLTRTSCHKTTHANGYYGAWPGWAVSISVLPLTTLVRQQYLLLFSIFVFFVLEMYLFTVIQGFLNLCKYENFHRDFF